MSRRVALAVTVAAALLTAAPADAAGLRAGVGRADITPQTGFPLGGWARSDHRVKGQHTRLFASALVLQRGSKKVALVAMDLFAIPGGMMKTAAEQAGFSERNVLVSASHTHAGPTGFANFNALNTVSPSFVPPSGAPNEYAEIFVPNPPDRQMYTFMVQRLATAIRRANANLGPAAAAWGTSSIHGLTKNRSVEAHLANHGIIREYGQGSAELDPHGVNHTIDPEVNVLRVDKLVRRRGRRRRVPIGAWSTFAVHGTVNKSTFQFYNQDHHGAALRVFERRVRSAGRVPRRQPVVNVYGNSNEGDQSAGLDHSGPADAEYVGRVEAGAMFRAWRRAGRRMTRTPNLDLGWTRLCFCGQQTSGGRVGDEPRVGAPFVTGSEEGRGPFYEAHGVVFEGMRSPVNHETQGHKLLLPFPSQEDFPKAVPLAVVRVGGVLIVSVPGEATVEAGRRIRAAVLTAAAGSGVRRAIVSGLVNEYVNYFTTVEEYDRQHYEGGSMMYGTLSSVLLQEQLAELTRRLVRGQAAQEPYPFDPTNGLRPDGPLYGGGAARASALGQPVRSYPRLGHATVSWSGGERGLDRPLDRAFVTVQRRVRRRWRRVTSDLGLQIIWRVDDEGRYTVQWEIPLSARRGLYRFLVRAKRYRFVTRRFRVRPTRALRLVQVPAAPGRVAVSLEYPASVEERDFTFRRGRAWGGRVTFRVGSRTVIVRRRRGTVFSVRAAPGSPVRVRARAARDRFGNRNGRGLALRG